MIVNEEREENAAVLNKAGGHAGKFMRKQLTAKGVDFSAKRKAVRVKRIINGFSVEHSGFDERVNLDFGQIQGRHILSLHLIRV